MSRRYRVRMNSEGMWCVEYGDGYTYVSGWRETPIRRIAAALNREGRRCVWTALGSVWAEVGLGIWNTSCGAQELATTNPPRFTYCPHCGAKIERE